MFGLGGMDPKKMNAMMSQLGIKSTEIAAEEVIIKAKGKEIKIKNPSVTKITMSGQDTFQVSGKIEESEKEDISESDIEIIISKTGASRENAKKVLEKTKGDLAAAILELKK